MYCPAIAALRLSLLCPGNAKIIRQQSDKEIRRMENMAEIKWNDRFNLGVDEIDKAHQKLFSIVNKLIAFTENPAKQRHACKEGIKYFKSYTIKHFAE